ncbi:hypothetical protein Bca101_076287 [Brassica carinata]
MSTLENASVDSYSVQRDYWRQVNESEGFDVENISLPSNSGVITGLMPYDCVRFKSYPHPVMVNLYAKVGLHRYNMFKETNFQLDSLVKFNMLQHCLSSFYITLLAHDPALHPLEKTFQVKVVNPKKPFVAHFHDAAKEDGKRFYLVKESEWQANDWIPMYLELVICADARLVAKRDVVSKLEILEVAIETGIEDVEPPNERLKATRANVYIKFKGLANVCSPRMIFEIGEHVERKAVVRRVLDKYGYLTISGKFCGGRSTQKQPSVALQNGKKIQSCKKRPRSD